MKRTLLKSEAQSQVSRPGQPGQASVAWPGSLRDLALDRLALAYSEPTADNAASALHTALETHGLTSLMASAVRLTGRAFDSDPWTDGCVYLQVWSMLEGRSGESPSGERRLTVEQATSMAWFLLERGECWADEVMEDLQRVIRGDRAPLIARAA